MPKSSSAVWRRHRFSSLFAALALVAAVSACDSSTGNDGDIASLNVSPPSATMNIGSVQRLVASPTTSGGRIIDADVAWISDAPTIASVDAEGNVSALAGGTANITATAGGESATAAVTVWFPSQTVTVAPAAGQPTTIRQEAATQLSRTVLDAQGNPLPRQVLWTSSNTTVARVSQTGRVSALGIDGTTTIRATTADGVFGETVITVSGSPVVATVTVSPTSALIGTGNTRQVTRTAAAASGTVIPGVATVWASSAAGVATVDAAGLVTAVAPGTANITATAEGITATSAFTVLTNLTAGVFNIPDLSDAGSSGGILDLALHIPAGTASFQINTDAGAGDIDLYVFAPGVTPGAFAGSTFSGFTCRPWDVGPTEECVINAPVAGVWRIRIHAFPEGGTVTGGTATVVVTPTP